MALTLLFITILPFVFAAYPFSFHNDSNIDPYCPPYEEIEHGSVSIFSTVITDGNSLITLRINCENGYDLDGPHRITCTNRRWDTSERPRCIPHCQPPPDILNGYVQTDNDITFGGTYYKGTLATYGCHKGYSLNPPESQYRVCEKSIWTGANATCVRLNEVVKCRPPKKISNGFYVNDQMPSYDDNTYNTGIRLYYSCKPGYFLMGNLVQQCSEDGTWSPKLPPMCLPETQDSTDDYPCSVAPTVPHATTTVVRGFQSMETAIPGTEVEIRCMPKYRNAHAPCSPSRLRCMAGKWEGTLPNCVLIRECPPPPVVPHGTPFDVGAEYGRPRYLITTKLAYQCDPGYEPDGNYVVTCSMGGCWIPSTPPVCKISTRYYQPESSVGSQLLISIAIGAGVLSLLLIVCLTIICRRHKPLSRAISLPPPVPRPHLVDHEALLHHPDRLALIAFADNVQVSQSALPTYEEAIRDRGSGLVSNRPPRPHWPSLAHNRRTRNSPDIVHVARQGSFASTNRSAGDPMGSTDTVVVSEGSTAITLDTASSYSGSQTASCRAHCGSLASFDTSSVHNTEGVPLLEENELEDNLSETRSLAMENQSMTDDGSYKLNRTSPDLV